MPRGGAQKKRSSFDNPTLLEESRTRSAPERRREADGVDRVKTPSSTIEWRWTFRFNELPKRWMTVTTPH